MKDGQLALSIGTPGTVGQTCTLGAVPGAGAGLRRRCGRGGSAPRWSVDFEGKLVVEDTMDPALVAALAARHPEARTMAAGWISFGSIKLAAPIGEGFSALADDRRAAVALSRSSGWDICGSRRTKGFEPCGTDIGSSTSTAT